MGEIPIEVAVKVDENEIVTMFLYWCSQCKRCFLYPEIIEEASCPGCGIKETFLLEEST